MCEHVGDETLREIDRKRRPLGNGESSGESEEGDDCGVHDLSFVQ